MLCGGIALWWSRRERRHDTAAPADIRHVPSTHDSDDALDALYDMLVVLHDIIAGTATDAITTGEGQLDLRRLYPIVQRVAELRTNYALALLAYFDALTTAPDRRFTGDLIAVDRILTAYTYHLRLFPLRRVEDVGIVLGMLHDVGDKVARALNRMEGNS